MVTITLRGTGDTGWYWSVKDDRQILRAGWAGTLVGAYWRSARIRRKVLRDQPDQA